VLNVTHPIRFSRGLGCFRTLLILVCIGAAGPSALAAQGTPARRLNRLLNRPPFNRATWGLLVVDEQGQTIYQKDPDRLLVPASTAKLAVTAAASAMFPPDYRITTSVYGAGPLVDGALQGDLVVYGRGDPGFAAHCYSADTLAAGACDSLWTAMDALADSLVQHGVREVDGAIVGDGSYFEPTLVHPEWEGYDLNWWYAAPVSALGFNDNSVNVKWKPGPRRGAPADVAFEPYLGNFAFENRTRTTARGSRRTIDFFRQPGTMFIWAEGAVPLDSPGRTEYFALPDPNLYFAQALRTALSNRGVSVTGPTLSTTDSLLYRAARQSAPLTDVASRPLRELIYPILNSSHNWYAEMLLKVLGRERGQGGSWEAGTAVVRRFLIDSVGVDSAAFSLHDGSGLARGDLLSPRAVVQLLRYMRGQVNNAGVLQALPRPGSGTLRDRLLCTAADGRLRAKTGSLGEVNALAGYLDLGDGKGYVFDIMANNHTARYEDGVAQLDSLVLALTDRRLKPLAARPTCPPPK
jgi:D-alanyl-D-alanine carboxypeptidase/D-alanyl-D-alanine-endopeptidase (penicillin-binding protein 4)